MILEETLDIIEEEYRDYIFRNKTISNYYSFLFEERHISNEVNELTDTIVDILSNKGLTKEYGAKETTYYKAVSEMNIGDNFFMINPYVLIKVIISDNTGNAGCSISPNLNTAFYKNKLYKPIIVIRMYNTKPAIDKVLLKSLLSHEIMHGYRMLNIFLRNKTQNVNNGNKPDYNEYSNYQEDDTTLERFVKESYYITDIDEINSNSSSEATYILNKKEINFVNYKNYLKEIPFYNKIIEIKKKILIINKLIKQNENIKITFGYVISRTIYKGKYDKEPIIAFNKMFNRLYRTYTYCVKRFYNILWAALEKDNRLRTINASKPVTDEELENALKNIII